MFTLRTFYRSKEWERFREQILQERTADDGYLYCEYSGKPILKKYDAIIHHKTELTEENVNDYSISLNPDNVMVVSFKSHNMIHERFEGFRQQVFIVYGSPCAGKTSWVRENAGEDDLILDLDAIWTALSPNDRLHKNRRLLPNVFGVRDTVIDQIRTRTGRWRNAFVVGTYPLRTERDRLADLLQAELVFIDEKKEICMDRAPDEDWKKYVEQWFEDFME